MRAFTTILFLALFALPLSTAAQSTTQTSASAALQAEQLLLQIAQLQKMLGGAITTQTQTVQGGTFSVADCPAVGYTLKPGASGADVVRLQKFLALDSTIYPEGLTTGYYGALTTAAVGRWQSRYNIVHSGTPATTGYGLFGPKTAAAVALQCSKLTGSGTIQTITPVTPTSDSDINVGGYIKVSPDTGPVPLRVIVEATVNTVKRCEAASYLLDWGDGSAIQYIDVPSGSCQTHAHSFTHTYNRTGSYSIKLSAGIHEAEAIVNVGQNDGSSGSTGSTITGLGNSGITPGTATNTGTSGTTAAKTVGVSMYDSSFSPKDIHITSGTRVVWTNESSMPHNVTADNGSYGSANLTTGQTYALTFTAEGTYTYHCSLHGGPGGEGMSGTITVE